MKAQIFGVILFAVILQLANCHLSHQNPSGDQKTVIKYRYLIFRDDCWDQYTKLNFTYADCNTATLLKLVGYAIVLAASAVKLPQLLRIYKSKSGKGVLPSTFYAECIMYIIKG
jgi:hypothetical protein